MTTRRQPLSAALPRAAATALLAAGFLGLGGCSALDGAFIGAAFGALLGGSTESALVGAGIGAGVGAIIDSDDDHDCLYDH